MAHVMRVFALLALLITGQAHALVPKVPASYSQCDTRGCSTATYTGATPQAVCSASLGGFQAKFGAGGWKNIRVAVETGTGGAYICQAYGAVSTTAPEQKMASDQIYAVGSVCPANSTTSGSSCACTAPFLEDSTHTSCVIPDELKDFCEQGAANKFTWNQSGTIGINSPMPSASCYKPEPPFPGPNMNKGCKTNLVNSVAAPREGDPLLKDWSGTGVMDGTVCEDATATDAAPKSADDPCPSGFPGTVNGVSKCVAAEPDKGIEGVKGTSQTNADGTKIDTKETTKCLGTVCTTTTNTTTTTSSGSVSNSTSSRTESLDDKCTKDPKNEVCKKTQGGAGGATSQMNCEANASAEGCGGEGAAIGDLYAKKDKTVAQAFTKAKDALLASPLGTSVSGFFNVQGGGSCPTSSGSFAVFNSTWTFSFAAFCSTTAAVMFSIIKGVLLMIAAFMAFRIAIDH